MPQLLLPPEIYSSLSRLKDFLQSLDISPEKIQNTDLFLCTFVHKSYACDFKGDYDHNERLEFVGDAILGSVIAKALFLDNPQMPESTMTLYKIALVREETLSRVAKKIGLHEQIFISKGEEKNHGRQKLSITSDALEALIGYLALDLGYETAESFILTYLYPEIENIERFPIKSYKTMAQEKIQKQYKKLPEYQDIEQELDDKGNVLRYRSEITIDGKVLSKGFGTSKKKAQEDAAKNYYNSSLE